MHGFIKSEGQLCFSYAHRNNTPNPIVYLPLFLTPAISEIAYAPIARHSPSYIFYELRTSTAPTLYRYDRFLITLLK